MRTAEVFNLAIDTGAGSQTITSLFSKGLNLSWAKALICDLKITVANTDATDTLDVYIEETVDNVTWNQRGRFEQITGDMSPTTTAPEVRRLVISALPPLDTTEESYETTGSTGGTSLSAGTVRNGPFLPPYRGDASNAPQASYRARLVVTDADNNADFEGTLTVFAVSEL